MRINFIQQKQLLIILDNRFICVLGTRDTATGKQDKEIEQVMTDF